MSCPKAATPPPPPTLQAQDQQYELSREKAEKKRKKKAYLHENGLKYGWLSSAKGEEEEEEKLQGKHIYLYLVRVCKEGSSSSLFARDRIHNT